MQTFFHDEEKKKELKQAHNNTALGENYFRVVGLCLLILGMTIAMVLLDIELLSLF